MPRKAKGPWWRADRKAWYVKMDGRQIPLGPDEQEAWRLFRRLMAGGAARASDLTAARLVSLYLTDRAASVRPRTLAAYRAVLDPFAAWLGDVPALDVTPKHLADWIAAKDYASNTGKQCRRVVKLAWSWATVAKHLPSNPLAGVRCGVIERRPDVSEADLAAWLPHVDRPDVRTWVELGLATGLRPSELARLAWRDVQPSERRARVRDGKTGDRWAYLSPPALAKLTELAAIHPTGPLLRQRTGRPWCLHYLQWLFARASDRAGVRVQPMHLRHLFGSRLYEAGVSTLAISRLMGHASTRMVDRYYVAISPSSLLAALDKTA